MDAAFSFGEAVGILSREDHRGALEAGSLARQHIGDVNFPTARFSPALVHPHEHVGPITRLRAAGAGVNADDAVAPVVRAAQENFQFQRVEFLEISRKVLFEFLLNFFLGLGRLRFAQLDHHVEILEFLFRLEKRLNFVPQGIGFLDEFLRLFAIAPEIIRRHQGVELAQALLRAEHVKETSADARAYRRRSSIRL